jgi:phosphate transport system permease protein
MELVSNDLGFQLLKQVRADPSVIGKTVVLTGPVRADASLYYKGEMKRATTEADRKLDDRQLAWLDKLRKLGMVSSGFNVGFLTRSDSTEPEQAGVLGAVVGSLLMLMVTAGLAVPIGVLAASYLEEFAPKNRWTDFIEVNINNLAAVPSIVYGLLGLAVFINWLAVPRSSPLVGGLVLALMALPTVIIATRSALRAVPPSIREAALGVGASKTQTVFHHVLPLAMPGVMTGAILSLAHALGETAPLLMIGMVSFVPGVPAGLTSAATVLPVQVFIWENASERAFHERTAAAIMVLLVFMILMNLAAILLRRRFERRW